MTDQKEIYLITPDLSLVGKSFLAAPDLEFAQKFPVQGKDGRNKNLFYKLKGELFPDKNSEHKEFVEKIDNILKDFSTQFIGMDVDIKSWYKKKPKKLSDLSGDKWIDDPESGPVILFKSRNKIPVFKDEEELKDEDLQLPSKTIFNVVVKVFCYNFESKEGKRLVGVSLIPHKINLLNVPEKRSFFPKKSLGDIMKEIE